MKTIFLPILFLIITSCSTTQKIPLADSYEKIIEVPNLSKDEIYIKANAWFVEEFKSAESVIQFQDKEAGKIMGKYTFKPYKTNYYFRNIISVEIRENKMRVKFYDPYFWNVPVLSDKGSYKSISSLGLAARNFYLSKYLIPTWTNMSNSLDSKLNESDDW
jgi:Domain of unknown function (DUF4468) with TBP-like fold